MKTVNFQNFTVTTNGIKKEFFEEGLIHNEMEMLSIVDARKHYVRRYDDDPFFETEPKDIEYVLDLYQKLELFDMGRIDFDSLEKSILHNSYGEGQPVWLHCDGEITEIIGNDFLTPIPENQINPVVAVFSSFGGRSTSMIKWGLEENWVLEWKKHIEKSIESKMIEIEAEHFNMD